MGSLEQCIPPGRESAEDAESAFEFDLGQYADVLRWLQAHRCVVEPIPDTTRRALEHSAHNRRPTGVLRTQRVASSTAPSRRDESEITARVARLQRLAPQLHGKLYEYQKEAVRQGIRRGGRMLLGTSCCAKSLVSTVRKRLQIDLTRF